MPPGRGQSATIRVRLQGYQQVVRQLANINQQLQQLNQANINVGGGGAGGGVGGAPAGAIGAGLRKGSIDFTTAIAGFEAFRAVDFSRIIADATRLSAEARNLDRAFVNMSRRAGVDAASALRTLISATQNQVSQMELMRSAMRLQAAGIDVSIEDFGRMAGQVVALGAVFGRTADESLRDLTMGLSKMSPMILDNIGVVVRLEDAYRKLAGRLGKTVQELTSVEKQQALLAETQRAINEAVQRFGAAMDPSLVKLNQLNASMANMSANMARIRPSIRGGVQAGVEVGGVVSESIFGFGFANALSSGFAAAGARGAAGSILRLGAKALLGGLLGGLSGGLLTVAGMELAPLLIDWASGFFSDSADNLPEPGDINVTNNVSVSVSVEEAEKIAEQVAKEVEAKVKRSLVTSVPTRGSSSIRGRRLLIPRIK